MMYLNKRGKDEGKPFRCKEHWVARSDCDGLGQETLEMLTEAGPLSCWLLSRYAVLDAFLSVKGSQLKLTSTKHNYGLRALEIFTLFLKWLRKPLLLGPREWVSDMESRESSLEAILEEEGLDPDTERRLGLSNTGSKWKDANWQGHS